MACDQLLHLTAEPARVDRCGIKLPNGVRTEQQTNHHAGEVGILGVTVATVGKVVEERGELRHDLFVERCQPLA